MGKAVRLIESDAVTDTRSCLGWRVAAFLAVLVGAAVLRCRGVLSGEMVWHPDEIFMVVYPLNIMSGDLNPHVFTYPAGHFYLLTVIYACQYLLGLLSGSDVSFSHWVIERYIWSPEILRETARWVSVICSVATVPVVGLLAGRLSRSSTADGCWRRDVLSTAAIIAMLLAAVNMLLVRQAPLAGTDTPLAFWFLGSTMASVRLLRDGSWRTYVLAGAMVGLCAATKYPGAAAAAGVIAAHLGSGRRLTHLSRLVGAGVVSILIFLVLSPYTLLDYATFAGHFQFQLSHATEGRWGLQIGPFYHLTTTLRHAHGLLAWAGTLLVAMWVMWRRPMPQTVVLTTAVSGYLAVSWGELAFARYVLPLIPLQAALLADGIVRVCAHVQQAHVLPRRASSWLLPLLVLGISLQPAYGAWHVARLQSSQDTRRAAKEWINAHVPAGSTLCNFGGWAGDPQVNTFEALWWRFTKYSQAYPQQSLVSLGAVNQNMSPFFSYAVQTDNEYLAGGSQVLVHDRRCGYVVTNAHPLPYSTMDASFQQELTGDARKLAILDPGSTEGSDFDPMDAYYIPLAGWGVSVPGPSIEIWQLPAYQSMPRQQDAVTVLSRAVSLNADTKLAADDTAGARADLVRALSLKSDNLHAHHTLANLKRRMGDLQAEEDVYRSILTISSDDPQALQGLAQLSSDRGDHAGAVDWYQRVRRHQPGHARLLNNLAIEFRAAGRQDSAVALWREALSLQDTYSDAHYNLGTAYYLEGDIEQALPHLSRAVELAPDSVRYHSNAAAAHRAAGMPRQAVDLWLHAVQIDSNYVDAYSNIAFTLQHDLHDLQRAVGHWRIVRRLAPADAEACLHGAQALLDLQQPQEAIDFLQQNPHHARGAELTSALTQIRQALDP